MSRRYLVRHAEAATDDDDDPGLSVDGIGQAHSLGDVLAGSGIDAIWHGPKRRTQETGAILAATLGCEARETDLLQDRTPVPGGARSGAYPTRLAEWFERVPEAERDPDGVALAGAWETICREQGTTGNLVLVTHAFVVAWFISRAMDAGPASWTRLAISNASISEIELLTEQRVVIHRVNDTNHLRVT